MTEPPPRSPDFRRLRECDVISICVPTPLNKTKDPDLSYVVAAAESCKAGLRAGQVIILESTPYPGTTREVLLPIFEPTGLKVGVDFGLCFSPERVDPGNPVWQTRNTPKVIGGITKRCNDAAMALYGKVFDTLVPVESPEAAELVKVYENTFRMINIALANELAQACEKLGVKDSWEFAFELMKRARVAVTPGRDFGTAETTRYVRFSTASSMDQLRTAVQRLQTLLA